MSKGKTQLCHVQRRSGFANDYEKAEAAQKLEQAPLEPELLRGDPYVGKRFREKGNVTHVVRKPRIDSILASGYATAWAELARLEKAAQSEEGLDADQLRKYRDLVDSFSKLARVEKDAFPEDDAPMTKEELIAAAEEAKRFLLEEK